MIPTVVLNLWSGQGYTLPLSDLENLHLPLAEQVQMLLSLQEETRISGHLSRFWLRREAGDVSRTAWRGFWRTDSSKPDQTNQASKQTNSSNPDKPSKGFTTEVSYVRKPSLRCFLGPPEFLML